jgi:hypothetical protein
MSNITSEEIIMQANEAHAYNKSLLLMDLWPIIMNSLSLMEFMDLCSTSKMFHPSTTSDAVFYSCMVNSQRNYGGCIDYPQFVNFDKSWQQRIGCCSLLNPLEQSTVRYMSRDLDETIYKNLFRCISKNDLRGMKFLLSFYNLTLKDKLNIGNVKHYALGTAYPQLDNEINGILREYFPVKPTKDYTEISYFLFLFSFLHGTKEMNILILEWIETINDHVEKKTLSRDALQFNPNALCVFKVIKYIGYGELEDDEITNYWSIYDMIADYECEYGWGLHDRYEAAITKSLDLSVETN